MIYLAQTIDKYAAKIEWLENKLPETTGKKRHRLRFIISRKKKRLRYLRQLAEWGVIYNKNNARKIAADAA